jgi:hypothetical protein
MRGENKTICPCCVDDYALTNFIEEHLSAQVCSFCGRQSSGKDIAASARAVLDVILSGIAYEYEEITPSNIHPDNQDSAYDLDIYNLLYDQSLEVSSRSAVLRWVIRSVGDARRWRLRMHPIEGLAAGWDDFCDAIKFQSRFLFFNDDVRQLLRTRPAPPPFYVQPSEVLEQLSKLIRGLSLVRDLPAGSGLFRARTHCANMQFTRPDELGPPPVWNCKAGRMNAAGIAVFYAALEEQTAIRETFRDASGGSVGTFETLRNMRIVDLESSAVAPSVFDEENRALRAPTDFLDGLREDIAAPVFPHDDNSLAYVPTQVVSEFLKHRFVDKSGKHIDGIVYPSTKRAGGRNIVLFMGRENIAGVETEFPQAEKLLRLCSSRTVVLDDWPGEERVKTQYISPIAAVTPLTKKPS